MPGSPASRSVTSAPRLARWNAIAEPTIPAPMTVILISFRPLILRPMLTQGSISRERDVKGIGRRLIGARDRDSRDDGGNLATPTGFEPAISALTGQYV